MKKTAKTKYRLLPENKFALLDGYKTRVTESLFTQAVETARLSIELAKLSASTKPESFLIRARSLILLAAQVIGVKEPWKIQAELKEQILSKRSPKELRIKEEDLYGGSSRENPKVGGKAMSFVPYANRDKLRQDCFRRFYLQVIAERVLRLVGGNNLSVFKFLVRGKLKRPAIKELVRDYSSIDAIVLALHGDTSEDDPLIVELRMAGLAKEDFIYEYIERRARGLYLSKIKEIEEQGLRESEFMLIVEARSAWHKTKGNRQSAGVKKDTEKKRTAT